MADKEGRTLFLIAVLPDRQVSSEVRMMKERLLDTHGLKAALRSPAHITLVPPFTCTDAQADAVADTLWKSLHLHGTVRFSIDGTGHFEDRVIYLNVIRSEALQALNDAVNDALRHSHAWTLRKEPQPFVPHITLANRDLRPERFGAVWADVRGISYQRTCAVGAIHLLRHDGARWKVWKEIPLGPVTSASAT
jgi:2'-5' RNA ligase